MSEKTDRRLSLVFVLLTGVTILSWWLGAGGGRQAFSPHAGITAAVLLIAAIKVRMIAWEFMELRHAPAIVRRIADAWLALLVAVLLGLYLFGTSR